MSAHATMAPVPAAPMFRTASTAQSYVQSGLIAQWDGIENAGYGQHDATATKPVELVSGIETTLSGTIPCDDISFELGSGYLSFTSTDIMDAVNSGTGTVEIVLAKNGTYVHNGGIVAFGEQGRRAGRGFWLWQQDGGLVKAMSYHSLNNEYKNIYYDTDGTNTLSFPLSDSSENTWYVGGIPAGTFPRKSTDIDRTATCWIGLLGSYNAKAVARIFSIRVYNRVLTPAEITANVAIDRRRFCLDAVGAHSYARGSLLAQWDGAENAGFGLHDADASYPAEIGSGIAQELTDTIAADDTSFELGSGYLHFESQDIIDALNAGSATVELVSAKKGRYVQNGGFLAFGSQSRALWIYQQAAAKYNSSNFVNCVSYHSTLTDQITDIRFNDDGTNTLSFLLQETSPALYTNGFARSTFTRYSTDAEDADCYIGTIAGKWLGVKPNADVFSIRVYGKVLSAEELENNQIVDSLRFALHTWTGAAGNDAWDDDSNWTHSAGAATAPGAGANVRIVGDTACVTNSFDLWILALEQGGTISLTNEVTVGTHVLLTNGVQVARGGYTGSGLRGQKVSWLTGTGLLRVGGGLTADIPAISEFPYKGAIIIVR